MDTELLKTFLEVEKTRHFGRAAENLYLTQAAVSSRIRQLENTLGVSLFNRYRNNINLTQAGERLKPHAQSIIDSLTRALREAAVEREAKLSLAIGGTPLLWEALVPRYLERLLAQSSDVQVRTLVKDPETLIRQLVSRTLDLAFLMEPPKTDELQVKKVDVLRLKMLSTRAQQSMEQAFVDYVQVDWGGHFEAQQEKLLERPLLPKLFSGSAHTALDHILKHQGSAYLPQVMTASHQKQGMLHAVLDAPEIRCEVYLVFHRASDKKEQFAPFAIGAERSADK